MCVCVKEKLIEESCRGVVPFMRLVGQKQVCGAVKAIGGGRVFVCFRSRPTVLFGGQRIPNQHKGEVSLYKNYKEY